MTSIPSTMGPCALCGQPVADGTTLCPSHHVGADTSWAAANRIMCDFVHRGIAAPRLSRSERGGDGVSTNAAEAA
jgi:hypothetical protein